jgi:hypothetical protein
VSSEPPSDESAKTRLAKVAIDSSVSDVVYPNGDRHRAHTPTGLEALCWTPDIGDRNPTPDTTPELPNKPGNNKQGTGRVRAPVAYRPAYLSDIIAGNDGAIS